MKLIVSIAFLLTLQTAFGQGYRGRKLSLSYQPAYSFIGYFNPELLIPIGHQKVNVGFALSNQLSINLTAQTSNGKKLGYYTAHGGTGYHSVQGDLIIEDKLVGVQLNYFRKSKSAFAPLGRYLSLGIEYGRSNSYSEDTVFSVNPNPFGEDIITTYPNYDDRETESIIILSFVIGRNFLVGDRFLLGYGMQLGSHLAPIWDILLEYDQPMRHFGKPFFNLGVIF
jgi:hypothetical protein